MNSKKLFTFLVATITLLVSGVIFKDVFANYFLTEYQEIEIKEFLEENENDPGWSKTFASLAESQGMTIGQVSARNPGIIRFLFKEPISLDGFSLFFYGNLHSHSSALAEEFWVYCLNQEGEWILLDEVKNNSLPFYRLILPNEVKAKALEIIITKPAFWEDSFSGPIWYKDFEFLKKEPINVIQGIKHFFNENKNSLLSYWVYYFLFLALLFLPGWVIASFIEKKKKLIFDPDLKFIFSPVFSIVFLFLSTILYLLSGAKIILGSYLLVLLISLITFLKMRMYQNPFKPKQALIFILLALFVLFLTIAHRDYFYNLQYIGKYLDNLEPVPLDGYFGYFADNLFPWRLGRIYLHRMPLFSPEAQLFLEKTNIFDRTPLLPMIIAGILGVFGEGHFVYQRFIEALGVLIYPVFYVLIKKYFSQRIALITLFLMLINVPLSFTPFNAEYFYKYFALYPILLALILLITNKDSNKIFIGLLAGFSFLIHPFTLFFSATLLLVYLVRYKNIFKFIRSCFPIMAILLFLFILWSFGPKIFGIEKTGGGFQNFYFDLYQRRFLELKQNFGLNKLIGFVYIFIPNVLRKGVNAETIPVYSKEFSSEFFKYSLLSNLTPLFFILFLLFAVKNFRRNLELIIFAISPLLLYWLFYVNGRNQAFNYGAFYFHLYPFSLPFFLSGAARWLSGRKKIVKAIFLGSYVIFMIFNLYYISGNFIDMSCASWIVKGLLGMILISYLFLSLLLFNVAVFNLEKN
ncbi:MAG: glycosyltransferase family 39 protein [Candidatus Shapirobacteria bacterium]